MGLHGPRVPPAESSDGSRPEGVPDGQSGGSAEPPRPHAACPEEAHLRQCHRETGQWPRGMMGRRRFRSQLSDGLPHVIVVRQGFAQSLLKRMSHRSNIPGCGVTFEIVSNIPGVSTTTWSHSAKKGAVKFRLQFVKKKKSVLAQCSSECCVFLPQDIHGPEDREMLARLAASTEDDQSADSEAAIEKYLRSVLAVENILTMDRLRQVSKF